MARDSNIRSNHFKLQLMYSLYAFLALFVIKFVILEGLNRFHAANLTLSSDVDQDT